MTTQTTPRDRINILIWIFGGFIFFVVGYVLGFWWHMLDTGFWLAGKTKEQIEEAQKCLKQ